MKDYYSIMGLLFLIMHFVFRFMVSATFLNQSAIEDSIESNLSTICFFCNKLCYMQMAYALLVYVQQDCSNYYYNVITNKYCKKHFITFNVCSLHLKLTKNVILIMCF